MVGIILATHGGFADGIMQSGSMIFGDQPDVAAVTLQPSEGPNDIRKKMEDAIASFESQDEVLFLVDLWGGTPFNQANGLVSEHEDKWAIVAGLNLPMLIDAYGSRMTMETAHEVAVQMQEAEKKGCASIRSLWNRRRSRQPDSRQKHSLRERSRKEPY